MLEILKIIGISIGLVLIIFALSLLPQGQRRIGPIENIHGIPYPETHAPSAHAIVPDFNPKMITEELAHSDVFLREPVLAKQLFLTVFFKPGNVRKLSVGVRQDPFWLSYADRLTIFPIGELAEGQGWVHQQGDRYNAFVEIPLADKLQDTDRSIDLMFFAEAEGQPEWELDFFNPDVSLKLPSYLNFKNYIRSIVKRERAL